MSLARRIERAHALRKKNPGKFSEWDGCAVCGNPYVPPNISLCYDCQEEYGKTTSDWPMWVLYMVRDRDRQRYYEARDAQRIDYIEDET